jgi:outer membrane protein OmpA-like peptidoglycan-associated protein
MTLALAHLRRVVAGLLPLAVVVGCASSDQDAAARAQLERAQIAYRQAQADPNVQSYAQSRLSEAQKAMQAAEQATDAGEMQHLGYVAEKKARIATTAGATRKMEQDTQRMGKETSDLLQKRDRELKAARMEAEAKGLEAEQARMAAEARARDAEAKAREAEQARTEAEQARVQAEQARMQAEAEIKARSAEQAKTAALTRELSDLRAQQTDRGLVLTVGDVLFATGKAETAAGAQRSVDKLVEFLKKNPKRNVLIEGHTDNTGAEDFNLKLSQQRADAVKDMLVARGVAAERITTKGYGPKYPTVANDTAAGRQQNRRVEVVVLNEGASAESAAR